MTFEGEEDDGRDVDDFGLVGLGSVLCIVRHRLDAEGIVVLSVAAYESAGRKSLTIVELIGTEALDFRTLVD